MCPDFYLFICFILRPTFGFLKEFGVHCIEIQKVFPQVYRIVISFNLENYAFMVCFRIILGSIVSIKKKIKDKVKMPIPTTP